MPYLNLDLDYFTHPKTVRLVALVGKEGSLYPLKMWSYLGKFHSKDGCFKGYSDEEIESLLGWQGEPKKLLNILEKVGFISKQKNEWCAHEFKQHQGHIDIFKKRAKHAIKRRWDKYKNQKTSNTTSNTKNGFTESSVPYRTIPNQTVPYPFTKEEADFSGKQLDDFNRFVEAYPSKASISRARVLFFNSPAPIDRLIQAVERYSAHLKAQGWDKKAMGAERFLEEWTDWENYIEPKKEETSEQRDARILAKHGIK